MIVRVGHHNHGSTRPDVHPSLRQLSDSQHEVVVSLTDAGVKPRQIEAHLQQSRTTDDEVPLVICDVYNIRHRHLRESLNGRMPIEALLSQLTAEDFVLDYELDTDRHVTHLFFASRRCLYLFSLYPEVLLLDCTYQTNRYGLPLLNMVGITGVKLSFLVGSAFLQSEMEQDFRWVLEKLLLHIDSVPGVVITDCGFVLMNALATVFPQSFHVLCRWHVRRSIYARSKSHFSSRRVSGRQHSQQVGSQLQSAAGESAVDDFMRNWDEVVYSDSITTYRDQWRSLQSSYRRDTSLLDYLRNTWLPLREHFMAPWVDQHLHLGATETSRVEGFHSVLKNLMGVSLHIMKDIRWC